MLKNWSPAVWAVVALILISSSACSTTQKKPADNYPSTQSHKDDKNGEAVSSFIAWVETPFITLGDIVYDHREVINASSTLLIGAFTIALFLATFGQLRHLRRDFDASKRPQIIIHDIRHTNLAVAGSDHTIDAKVSYVDIGLTDAFNVVLSAKIIPINGEPVEDYKLPEVERAKRAIPGVTKEFTSLRITSPYDGRLQSMNETLADAHPSKGAEINRMHCIGTITYSDGRKIRRQLGFCWRWSVYRWEPVPNTPKNYSY